jgi:hypothetical protein
MLTCFFAPFKRLTYGETPLDTKAPTEMTRERRT